MAIDTESRFRLYLHLLELYVCTFKYLAHFDGTEKSGSIRHVCLILLFAHYTRDWYETQKPILITPTASRLLVAYMKIIIRLLD